MKTLIAVVLFLALVLSFRGYNSIVSRWSLNIVTINSDTAFIRGDSLSTRNYILFNANKPEGKSEEEKQKNIKRANQLHEEFKSIWVEFYDDTLFAMTKLRSGRKFVHKDEIDSGVYTLVNDSISLVNRTRKNYRMDFILDQKKEILYSKDSAHPYTVYWEFIKVSD